MDSSGAHHEHSSRTAPIGLLRRYRIDQAAVDHVFVTEQHRSAVQKRQRAARLELGVHAVATRGLAAALRRPDLAGTTVDIGGPEALDGVALAEALSAEPGRPLTYCMLTPEQVEQQLAPHLGLEVARGIAANYAWMARRRDSDFLTGTSDVLTRELRRPRRTMREWARGQGLRH